MPAILRNIRAVWVSMLTAALVLASSPARAEPSPGLGAYGGPIATWLARAPAACVIDSYFVPTSTGFHVPATKHVAYWVNHAMDGDFNQLSGMEKIGARNVWSGTLPHDVNQVWAVDDVQRHVSAFLLGPMALHEWGAFASAPEPPPGAPAMHADLSKLSLGGNVHLGDSLRAVTRALGLHTLTLTQVGNACPGFAIVELCAWNVAGCACPPGINYEGSRDISGTIIFHNRRVAGFVWDAKCFPNG